MGFNPFRLNGFITFELILDFSSRDNIYSPKHVWLEMCLWPGHVQPSVVKIAQAGGCLDVKENA